METNLFFRNITTASQTHVPEDKTNLKPVFYLKEGKELAIETDPQKIKKLSSKDTDIRQNCMVKVKTDGKAEILSKTDFPTKMISSDRVKQLDHYVDFH